MEFLNTTTKIGIINQIEKLTGLGDGVISGNATYLKQFTGDVNNAYSRVANLILKADGRMQWDDPNHTNASIANFDLVSGQKNYSIFVALPTALQDWLQVEAIDILSNNGEGLRLTPINTPDLDTAESEFEKVSGTPVCFDFHGSEVFLYPAPNYNKTAGGTIFFKRSPSYYASTDTTKVPGFATLFHELLPLWASYWWGVAKGLGYTNQVRQEISLLEIELKKFYARRSKFQRLILKPEEDNCI